MEPRLGPRRLFLASVVIGSVLTFASAAVAANPMAGETGKYRGQCRKLTKQIDHFEETILPMAIQRGNRSWEKATNAHIERLWNRRADLCPAYGAERTLMAKTADQIRRFNKMMAAAGRAALAFFTGGLSGVAGP